MHDQFEDLEIRARSAEPLDAGTYPATLAGYQRVQSQYGGEQLRLDFEVSAPDNGTRKLAMYCSWSSEPSPRSKLYQVVTALRGGQPLADGETLKLRPLIGAKCIAWVEHKQLADGRVVEKIAKITPVKRKPAPTADEEGDPFA